MPGKALDLENFGPGTACLFHTAYVPFASIDLVFRGNFCVYSCDCGQLIHYARYQDRKEGGREGGKEGRPDGGRDGRTDRLTEGRKEEQEE